MGGQPARPLVLKPSPSNSEPSSLHDRRSGLGLSRPCLLDPEGRGGELQRRFTLCAWLQGKFWHASTTGHALLVSALGLLLVFRTNTVGHLPCVELGVRVSERECSALLCSLEAYSRFWEGRQIWQRILDLGRHICPLHVHFAPVHGVSLACQGCFAIRHPLSHRDGA